MSPAPAACHIGATILPYGDSPRDVWVADGRITFSPQDGAEELAGAYVLPGLVDCHVHLTLDFANTGLTPGSREIVADARRRHLESGTLLLRDIGTLSEDVTIGLPDDGLPRVHPAGRLLAPPGRYFGVERPTPEGEVVEVAVQQVKAGAEWVKLIGDWPTEFPDFTTSVTNYSDAAVSTVVERVHAAGACVAVHATSREGVVQAIAAGVDTIEHGVGADEALVRRMGEKGITLSPTIAIEQQVLAMVAESDSRKAVDEIREKFAVLKAAIARAPALDVRVLAGTDMFPPGSVWREVAALFAAGLDPVVALAAATTAAREYLGEPALEEGAPADLVIYEQDPRNDPEVLSRPTLVMFSGRIVRR